MICCDLCGNIADDECLSCGMDICERHLVKSKDNKYDVYCEDCFKDLTELEGKK